MSQRSASGMLERSQHHRPVSGSGAAGALLTDGISQDLKLFGRSFHVQTEISNGALRTEVFLGGRLLAAREARLEGVEAQAGPDAQRTQMKEHHQRLISVVRERAQRYLVRPEEFRLLPSPQPGPPHSNHAGSKLENCMSKVNLGPLSEIDGFLGSCLVDTESGMVLGKIGGGPVNLELAAAGNTQVVRAKRKTMESLQLNDRIEDILISLKAQYHLIRPLESNERIFLYLVLDRGKANLAMARHELRAFEASLKLG